MKVYFFPPKRVLNAPFENPYRDNYMNALSKYSEVLNIKERARISSVANMMKYLFKADVFIINWPEDIPMSKFGKIQSLVFIILLFLIKRRKATIIWMFHNFRYHGIETFFTRLNTKIMYKYADIIIAHSKEAYDFLINDCTFLHTKNVYFHHHPVKLFEFQNDDFESENNDKTLRKKDVLIWGSISPYKGIVEFLEFIHKHNLQNSFFIHIIGKCPNQKYAKQIMDLCNDKISFENRSVSFEELKIKIRNYKYTLFPYTGECVSSSGALIDTIALGGLPIGPNKGAFKDLMEESIALNFENYDELITILSNNFKPDEYSREKFIKNNSWDSFASVLIKEIN